MGIFAGMIMCVVIHACASGRAGSLQIGVGACSTERSAGVFLHILTYAVKNLNFTIQPFFCIDLKRKLKLINLNDLSPSPNRLCTKHWAV